MPSIKEISPKAKTNFDISKSQLHKFYAEEENIELDMVACVYNPSI